MHLRIKSIDNKEGVNVGNNEPGHQKQCCNKATKGISLLQEIVLPIFVSSPRRLLLS